MVLTMLPTTVFATEDIVDDIQSADATADDNTTVVTPVCTCDTLCQSADDAGDCPVCSVDDGWLYDCDGADTSVQNYGVEPLADGEMAQADLVTAISEAYEGSDTVTLTGNITTDSTITIAGTVTIDLAGYDIHYTGGGTASVITVTDYGNLTLKDTGSTGTRYITGVGADAVISDETSTDAIEVTGGVIYGGQSNQGGGVWVEYGAFTMKGGTIAGNKATSGSYPDGGGVYINGGTFEMDNGTITGNSSSNGSGVYIGNYSSFIMSNGKISGNNATQNGGGVYIEGGSTATMSGGEISGNSATNGAGVCNYGTFKLSGASSIQAVYLGGNTKITLTDEYTGAAIPVTRSTVLSDGGTYAITSGASGYADASHFTSTQRYIVGISDGEVTFTNPDYAATVTVSDVVTEYNTLELAVAYANENGGTVTLYEDAVTTATLTISNTMTLDLNGYDIDGSDIEVPYVKSVITITGNGNLTLQDTGDGTGQITGGSGTQVESSTTSGTYSTPRGGGVFLYNASGVAVDAGAPVFNLEGGNISGNTTSGGDGGGVYIWGTGTFNMSGGTISDNNVYTYGTNGGGVYAGTKGTINMTGGTISGNNARAQENSSAYAGGQGGGVYAGGVFNMSGDAIISGNRAHMNTYSEIDYGGLGGGVFTGTKATFTMSGDAEISGNTAYEYGGGVYATGDTSNNDAAGFFMYGGSITDNTSKDGGGGVYLKGDMTMTDGSIDSNEATGEGGGIYINASGASLTMSGGTIGGEGKANTAGDGGGGVYIDKDGVFTMTDAAVISYNVADNTQNDSNDGNGGGVYISSGTFNMEGGTIEYNTAESITSDDETDDDNGNGGGVYVNYNTAEFTMSGGTIQCNTAEYKGGGVYVYDAFTMEDGALIDGNTAVNGGGVYINGQEDETEDVTATFTMNGGTISNNGVAAGYTDSYITTEAGGGVYITDHALLEMNNGAITGNTATGDGGGVYIGGDDMDDDNTDGSVSEYEGPGYFQLNGGSITENDATGNGGGVYLSWDGKLNIGDSNKITVTGNTTGGTDVSNIHITSEYNTSSEEITQTLTVDATPVTGSSMGITLSTNKDTFTTEGARAVGAFTSDEGYTVLETAITVDETTTYTYATSNDVAMVVYGNHITDSYHDSVQKAMDAAASVTGVDTVYLLNNVTTDSTITVTNIDGVVLDLNGFDITADTADTNFSVITVNGGKLTLTDGSETDEGILSGGTGTTATVASADALVGGGVYVWNSGSFTMTGGIIGDNTANYGAGVYVSTGSFEMTGGVIGGSDDTKNSATTNGGGLFVNSGVTATLSGGFISYNYGGASAGVYNAGTLTIQDGFTISNNSGGSGAGLVTSGTVYMTGGSITNNTTTGSGGGVYLNGTFYISGAVNISGNTKGDAANNVYLVSGKYFTVTGSLSGASIGITTAATASDGSPVTVAVGYDHTEDINDYTLTTTDNGIFSKDVSSAAGVVTLDEDTNKIQLDVAHIHSWSYDYAQVTNPAYAEDNSQPETLDDTTTIVATCSDVNGTCDDDEGTLQIKAPTELTYTGNAIEATLDNDLDSGITVSEIAYYVWNDSDSEYQPMDSSPINVGSYKATVTVSSVTAEVTYTITAADGTVSVSIADWTYGATASTPVPTSATNTGSVTYKYKGASDTIYTETTDVPTNAGDYTVTATFAASGNYKATTATDTFTISPATLTVSVVTANSSISKTYDGTTDGPTTAPTLLVSGQQNSQTITASATSWVYDHAAVNDASTITVTAYTINYGTASSSNYTCSTQASTLTHAATITQATITGAWTNTTVTYTGDAQTPVMNSFTGVVGEDVVTATCTGGTVAGTYTSEATLDNGNYILSNPSTSFTINKDSVTFTMDSDGAVSPSTEVAFTVTYTDKDGTVYDSAPTDSGSYTVAVTIIGGDGTNYNVAGSASATGSIGTYTVDAMSYTATFGETTITSLAGALVIIPEGNATAEQVFLGWRYGDVLYKVGDAFTQPSKNVVFTSEVEAAYDISGTVMQAVDGEDAVDLTNATVTLMSGSTVVAESVTVENGSYTFDNVTVGTYNIVVTYNGITRTALVTIIDHDQDIETITMPSGITNSIVEVTSGTPEVVVGGLDEIFESADTTVYTEADADVVTAGGSVELVLTVEEVSATVTETVATAIEALATNVAMYLDINILKNVDNGVTIEGTAITEVPELLTIVIPLPAELQGMKTYSIFRQHGADESNIDEITTEANDDGEYIVVYDTEIYLYAKYFSTYALAYTEYTSSGGTASTYSSSVATTANGEVSLSATRSTLNKTVTITPTPDDGYQVADVTVTYSSGREVTVTDNGDGTYSYLQPGASVTVTVTFVEIGSETESEDTFFADVDEDDWFYDAVKWAVEHGVTSGSTTTTFSPYNITTRGQTVTFLWRSMEMPEAEGDNPFIDIVDDMYYSEAVLWAYENGITLGTSDTTFSPNMDCSRAHIITFLWRMMGKPVVETENPFADVSENAYYYNAVLWAVSEGITSGTTATTFSPNKDCTRAEIVTFLYRALAD